MTGAYLQAATKLNELDAIGARFTLCYPRSKVPIGDAWQKRPARARRAARHLAGGGNVGLLCGHGGVYVIDFDKLAAERLAQFPKLARTKQARRFT